MYENSGSNLSPDFNFIQRFLRSGLDFGENVSPTFYDHNGDGLLDLFIGNYGYHLANGTPISKVALLSKYRDNPTPRILIIVILKGSQT